MQLMRDNSVNKKYYGSLAQVPAKLCAEKYYINELRITNSTSITV
ncbi:hypothetical protein [Prevotella sp.]|nr:hypothetical protein [Prevotella sp.]